MVLHKDYGFRLGHHNVEGWTLDPLPNALVILSTSLCLIGRLPVHLQDGECSHYRPYLTSLL